MAKEETKKTTKKSTTKKSTPKAQSSTKTKKEAASKTTTRKSKTAASSPTIVQEENSYGKTILAAILIIVVVVAGYLAIQYNKSKENDEDNYVATADEAKFKEEYESLNGTTRSNGQTNKEISIIEDNNIVYLTVEEAAEMLDSGSGVIYFGFAACPWCRNAVPVLLNAMQSSELDTIYYVDVRPNDDAEQDIRDTFTLNSRNKAKKTKDADEAYYDILLALANELSDYVLTTDEGKEVNTGEKRLYAPTVVAVESGVVVGFHEGTVEGHVKNEDGSLPDLTTDEETELLNTYSSIIAKYLDSDCSADSTGC